VREVANKFGYEAIRYLMIASHYRSPINYSREILNQCSAALARLYNCKNNLDFLQKTALEPFGERDDLLKEKFLGFKQRFIEAMEDDLNTANALSALFDLAKCINTEFINEVNLYGQSIAFAKDLFCELAGILGILNKKREDPLNTDIEKLIAQRELARQDKNWEMADEIRLKLKQLGVELKDTKSGIQWGFVETTSL
jgi:cysteinyl-tRNA synthetase